MSSKTLLLFLLSISIYSSKAQTFNYSLQKDSSAYVPLAGATVVCSGENFRSKSFMLALPFSFHFCGDVFDSISVEGNGFVVFDKEKGTSIVAYNSFGSNKDTAQNYTSSILSLTEGTSGNHILKLEFKDLSQNQLSADDNLSYQVWLYENGNKIEFHTGSNSYAALPDFTFPVLLGLINRNMDTENKAFLVTGNPASPTTQLVRGEGGLVYLNNVLPEGTVIKLIPTF